MDIKVKQNATKSRRHRKGNPNSSHIHLSARRYSRKHTYRKMRQAKILKALEQLKANEEQSAQSEQTTCDIVKKNIADGAKEKYSENGNPCSSFTGCEIYNKNLDIKEEVPQDTEEEGELINVNEHVETIMLPPIKAESFNYDSELKTLTGDKVDDPLAIESNDEPKNNNKNESGFGSHWILERLNPRANQDNWLSLVDFRYIFEVIKNLEKHSGIGCGLKHFKVVGVERNGLKTAYIVRCTLCGYSRYIQCIKEKRKSLDINHSAVSAIMVTGGGYNELEQLLTSMKIFCMPQAQYNKCQQNLIDAFEFAAQMEMEEAGREEQQLAIARGDVWPGTNIPWIPVVADGSFVSKSYRGGEFKSLSGVAAIVGYHTGKVLHIGIKNKFCMTCQIAERHKAQPQEHRCFKNWGRYQRSTEMESAAILEGFNSSLGAHGLIYAVLIVDGKSNVYKKIVESDPYEEFGVRVRKIQCVNHMLRDFGREVYKIAAKSRNKDLKNLVKENIVNFQTCIKNAAKYRFKENLSLPEQIKKLKSDLRNMPNHVFGEHRDCKTLGYFCKSSDPKVVNYVPQLKQLGIYQSIEIAMRPFFAETESLLYSLNNNAVIDFNNVIGQFIGGKKINVERQGSYRGRVNAAVVQYNTKEVLNRLSVAMNKSPSLNVKQLEQWNKYPVKDRSNRKRESEINKLLQNCTYSQNYDSDAKEPEIETTEFPDHETGETLAAVRKWHKTEHQIVSVTHDPSTAC